MVMEYMEGGSLRQVLSTATSKLDESIMAYIAQQVRHSPIHLYKVSLRGGAAK